MPSHQIRVQQNTCDHDFVETTRALGHVSKTCTKCQKTILEPEDK